MRWILGNYTLKYNPKTLSKTWSPQTPVNVGANGLITNPNLLFNGQQSFSIEIYDKPTKATVSTVTGSYIGITEKRVNEHLFLLKSGGAFDEKDKSNVIYGSHTITSGNGVSLPSGSPSSINHWDTGLAFIYPSSNQASLLITDENGVANRKYIYSSDDSKYITDIAWDYNSKFIALNPYGQIYTIDTSTGAEALLFQFDDYSTNKSISKNRYSSIIMYDKNGKYYMGVLTDSQDILFIDYVNLIIVSKSETGLNNQLAISYSNYSNATFSLLSSKVMSVALNTCRLEIEQLKTTLNAGQVTVTDEQGFQYVLVIATMGVTREPNSNEARYEVSIDGNIAYTGMGFGNAWTKNSRG